METAILGNDTMGADIMQTMAQKSLAVTMEGRNNESLDRTIQRMNEGLSHLVKKDRMTADDLKQIIGRIIVTIDYVDAAQTDLVIEAISEEVEVKKEILHEIGGLVQPSAIFTTNTSPFSITGLASITKRPKQVTGIHFFNPILVMKLAEVISSQCISEQTLQTTLTLCEQLGKTAVRVNEAPGFAVNHILIPMINGVIGEYADGIATVKETDTAMQFGTNHPMGPLALGDFIGLDVCLVTMEVLNNEYADPKHRPHSLLRKIVRARQPGRKSNEGSYDYSKKQSLLPRGQLYRIKPKAKHND